MEPSPPPSHGNLPPQFRLDISVSRGNAEEFELLRSGISPLFAIDTVAGDRASFRSRMTSYQFADIAISASRSSAARYERATQTIARGAVDNICLLVYSEGGCRFDAEGRSTEINPGDVCIFDMTRPSTVLASDFANLSFVLPRALLETQLANLDGLHGQVLAKPDPLNAMLVSHLRTLYAQAPALSVSGVRAAAQGATALIAAFAGASASGREAIRNAAAANSLQAARRIIEANLHDQVLSPDFICSQLGMSRAKLYRLFEPTGGVSQYILQRRMMRAYHNLIDPAHAHERISTIAARHGFSNASMFSRAFRQAHGVSPSDFREVCTRINPVDTAHPFDNDFATMRRWLLGPNVIR